MYTAFFVLMVAGAFAGLLIAAQLAAAIAIKMLGSKLSILEIMRRL